jgi:hypothetical protein
LKRLRGWALLALVLLCGCADAIRISAAAGRVVCGALGCPCTSAASSGGSRPVAFDVSPDGTVRPVYAEGAR